MDISLLMIIVSTVGFLLITIVIAFITVKVSLDRKSAALDEEYGIGKEPQNGASTTFKLIAPTRNENNENYNRAASNFGDEMTVGMKFADKKESESFAGEKSASFDDDGGERTVALSSGKRRG